MTEKTDLTAGFGIQEIMKLIPHRYPFLLIDKVIEYDGDNLRLVAIKNVTMNEPHFVGHYPEYPVMPGVLMVEAMAQASCLFLLKMPENEGKLPFFTGIDKVKFRRQVGPGDQLRIEAKIIRFKRRMAKCEASITVDGERAAEAKLTCMITDAK